MAAVRAGRGRRRAGNHGAWDCNKEGEGAAILRKVKSYERTPRSVLINGFDYEQMQCGDKQKSDAHLSVPRAMLTPQSSQIVFMALTHFQPLL